MSAERRWCTSVRRTSDGFARCTEDEGHSGDHAMGLLRWANVERTYAEIEATEEAAIRADERAQIVAFLRSRGWHGAADDLARRPANATSGVHRPTTQGAGRPGEEGC